jgi:hypothetical protein
LKILYHHRIRSKDGQAVHLEELIGALRGLGHEVLLVGPNAFARASFGHDPKLIVGLKKFAPNILYELLELGYNVPAYVRLHRACRKFRPDFIYERYNLYTLDGTWCGRLRDRLGQSARALLTSRGYTWQRNVERVSALWSAAVRCAAAPSSSAVP